MTKAGSESDPEAPAPLSVKGGAIAIENVSIIFGEGETTFLATDRIDASVAAGEFVCILGPSGCGKSTLLNAFAGLETPSWGQVVVDGQVAQAPGPDRGMVFQQPALFPWKSVRDNVAFGPRMAGTGDADAGRIADELLEMVGLANFGAKRPQTLSGGMQQRVAIARALANRPNILLMDEPFGALDAQTRVMMQENLLQLWAELGMTIMFVTHDIDEAIFLADRVLVMSASPGRIVAEVAADIPRPRSPDTLVDARFVEAKRQCMEIIRVESQKAFEQQVKRTG